MLPPCGPDDSPFSVFNTMSGFSLTDETPGSVCALFATARSAPILDITEYLCSVGSDSNSAVRAAIVQTCSTVVADPVLLGITPLAVAEVVGWGFGAVFFLWVIGYGIGIATGMIKKV